MNLSTTVPVFFSCDDNYLPFLSVALRSMIDNLAPSTVCRVHILNDGLREDGKARLLAMQTDRVTLEPASCEIRALFEQLIRETPHTSALAFEIAACDDAPLFCDPAHIRETLANLISNASEAMHGTGKIVLSYAHSMHKAVITVSDNGPGMTQTQQKRIFEPYFTTKTSGENFGLGLYYCQNVMTAHGGQILVKSAPGKGCTFSLIFPISASGRDTP